MAFLKYLVYSLIVGGLIGNQYSIGAGITYTDLCNAILGCIAVFSFFLKKWKIDVFFKYNLIYAGIMLFAGLVNATLTNTVFLNYFRIYIEGLIVYYCLFNTLRCEKDLKTFLWFFGVYLVFFVSNTKTFALSSFETAEYHTFTEALSYGRNAWGFTGLLIGFFAIYLAIIKYINKLTCAIVVAFSVFVVILSISRFATISFIIIILFYCFLFRKEIGIKNVFWVLIGIILVGSVLSYLLSFVSQDILDMELEYLYEKLNGASSDFKESRIDSINKEPIRIWLQTASPFNYLVGDGIYIGHSVLAHTLLSTGIIGMLYYFFYTFKLFMINIRKNVIGKSLALLIAVMFTNDFIANSRFIIIVNACLYMIIAAYISKTKQIKTTI